MVASIYNASDSLFSASGRNHFPSCFTCGQYSPFMIYLGYNEKSIKFCPEAKRIQLFCPICSPHPALFRQLFPNDNLFRADSILNDQRLLALLEDFVYSHPDDEQYSNMERIIITENTQLHSPYKVVAKRKAPKSFKLKLLMNLFPEAHRMPNRNCSDENELCETMKQKYHDICVSYMNISEAGGSQLIDNFDILIDKTPRSAMRPKPRCRTAMVVVPQDSIIEECAEQEQVMSDSDREIRAVDDSDDESDLASIASGVVNEFQISSAEPSGIWDVRPSSQSLSQHVSQQSSQMPVAAGQSSSQSVDISSQSMGNGNQSELSYGSDSSDSCVIDMPPPPRRTGRRPPSADDGQQPGPSNIKRRRVSPRGNRPTNPTPEEVQRNPHGTARLPRLDGG
ncbi:uncharacterized protein LOC134208264 isoform X2 [Armigeres subalbatus]|uniref:uncharacterized protein LOC134208264 isoform X2 n=1 Tax=Armigeres subalbatus TaxID=124917 RepID=UPI002ED27D66